MCGSTVATALSRSHAVGAAESWAQRTVFARIPIAVPDERTHQPPRTRRQAGLQPRYRPPTRTSRPSFLTVCSKEPNRGSWSACRLNSGVAAMVAAVFTSPGALVSRPVGAAPLAVDAIV